MSTSLISSRERHAKAPKPFDWNEFRANFENLDLACRNHDRAAFRVGNGALGDLTIRTVASEGAALQGERSSSRISYYRDDLVWICLLQQGSMHISQASTAADLRPGDFVIVDAIRPFSFEIPSVATGTLWIGVPRHLATAHIWDIESVLAQRIDGGNGGGLIASRMLQGAFLDLDDFSGAMANRISHSLLDVLAAAADESRAGQRESKYRSAIIRRVKRYIETHLDDDALTVSRIADAQRLSTRYLSKLFEEEEQTVAGWLWQRRLERCHLALSNATSGSVAEVAFSYGFKNVSHFSRVFRKKYGLSPRAIFRLSTATAGPRQCPHPAKSIGATIPAPTSSR